MKERKNEGRKEGRKEKRKEGKKEGRTGKGRKERTNKRMKKERKEGTMTACLGPLSLNQPQVQANASQRCKPTNLQFLFNTV